MTTALIVLFVVAIIAVLLEAWKWALYMLLVWKVVATIRPQQKIDRNTFLFSINLGFVVVKRANGIFFLF
jgi:hypothetical protein